MTLKDIRPVEGIHSLHHRLRHTNKRALSLLAAGSGSTKAIQNDSQKRQSGHN
jgi:hypothetical protein